MRYSDKGGSMQSAESVLGNGQDPKLRDLRGAAARAGIPKAGTLSRPDLIRAIGMIERQVEERRQECAAHGLSTEGSLADLELRLVGNQSDSTRRIHRRTYWGSVAMGVGLGLAGLGISLPHISAELSTLMNVELVYGILFALVIDGGFITAKAIDSLGSKFEFSRIQRGTVWVLMSGCLVMSATLNASQFLRHVEQNMFHQSIAVALAIFISLFVFTMFYLSGSMVVRCENRKPQKARDRDPVQKLMAAANDLKELQALAAQA